MHKYIHFSFLAKEIELSQKKKRVKHKAEENQVIL